MVGAAALGGAILVAGCTPGSQSDTARKQRSASAMAGGESSSIRNENSAGGVAVIDLDEVARRLGSDKQMQQALQQERQQVNRQFAVMQASYQEQIEAEENRLGPHPPQEQFARLAQLRRQAKEQLQSEHEKLEQELLERRGEVIRRFRDRIKPVALQIARSKNLQVVITKNQSVLFTFDQHVDITEAVVRELQSAQAAQQGRPQRAATESSAGGNGPAE